MAPKQKTRELLLEAGRKRVVTHGLPEGIDVKLTDVLADVGLSTGAAYNIWPSQTSYRQDLSLHIAESFEWADATELLKALGELPEDSTIDDWIRKVADVYFPLFIQGLDYFVVLHFWSVLQPRPELVQAMRRGYDEVHEGFVALYADAFERYGVKIAEPYNFDEVVAICTAVLEGFAIRHRFQADRLMNEGRHLYTETMSLLGSALLEPQ